MFSFHRQQGYSNQNTYDVPSYTCQNVQKQVTANVGLDVEQGEHFWIAGRSIYLHRDFGSQYGNGLPQNPVISLLGIYSKDAQSCHRRNNLLNYVHNSLICNRQNLVKT